MNIAAIGFLISSMLVELALVLFNMHMFQLNTYKHREHRTWILKNKNVLIGRVLGVATGIVLFLVFPAFGIFLMIACNIVTAYGNRMQKAKIPLHITKRVKRMLITIALLYVILLAVTLLFGKLQITVIVMSIFSIMTPYVILLADSINMPVEKSINRKFIKEAKDILRAMPGLTVIGVTGSYGKTSVKYILNKLLSAKYNVLMTPGNYNTTLGVVRTVREYLRPIHEIFICEMGAKNVGDIKEICDLVNPKYGIITSIGPQHLESFLTIENVIKTKFELADALPEEGCAFLNYDNQYIAEHQYQRNKVTFGTEKSTAQFKPYDVHITSKGVQFKICAPNGEVGEFVTLLIGKHNVNNIAGAIAIAYTLGIPMKALEKQVKKLEPIPHRLQLINTGRGLIIDDAYNSNPEGAKAAVETLALFEGIRILVTPGMIELGAKQYELNKEFGRYAAKYADYIILIGAKQTVAIQEGVHQEDFPKDKLMTAETLEEGMAKVDAIGSQGRTKIILLENDLPDNY